jgi:hypothetical protein
MEMKRLLVLFLMCVSLCACSTVSGVGKDLSSVADWTKDKMGGK